MSFSTSRPIAVASGTDVIADIPTDHLESEAYLATSPETDNRMFVHQGGLLRRRPDAFVASISGTTPRQAAALHPQQPLLLEVRWNR